MDEVSSQNDNEIVQSLLALTDRIRQIDSLSAKSVSSEENESAKKLLAEIELSIESARLSIEEIRLARTRPKTDRNVAFLSEKKKYLVENYLKLERAVLERESRFFEPSKTLSNDPADERLDKTQKTDNVIGEIKNLTRIAIGSTQYEPKKRQLEAILARLENENIRREVLERIRDRIAENTNLPPSSIEEIEGLMNDS